MDPSFFFFKSGRIKHWTYRPEEQKGDYWLLVLRIWMFLDLQDPDPLVRDTDPDPSIIEQKQSEKPWFLSFVPSLWLDMNVTSKNNKQKTVGVVKVNGINR